MGTEVVAGLVFEKMPLYMSHTCHMHTRKIAFPVYAVVIVICVSCGQHLLGSATGWATRHCLFVATGWVLLSWKPSAWGCWSGILANAIALTLQSLPGWFICNYKPVCSYSTAIISVTIKMVSPSLLKRGSMLEECNPAVKLVNLERSLPPIV